MLYVMPCFKSSRGLSHLFFMLLILPLVLLTLSFGLWTSYQTAISQAEFNSRNLASTLASRFELVLNRALSILEAQAHDFPLEILKPAEVANHRDMMTEPMGRLIDAFPDISSTYFFDASGDMLYASTPNISPTNIADRPFFKTLRDDPNLKYTFSEALIARTTGRWSVVIAHKIVDSNGQFLGVTTALLDLSEEESQLKSLQIGTLGTISIRRSDNSNLLLRVPSSIAQLGKPLPPENPIFLLLQSGQQEGAVLSHSSIDSVERLVSIKKLPNYPFFVQVGLAKDDYLRDWYREIYAAVVLGSLCLFIIALATVSVFKASRKLEEKQLKLVESEARFREMANSAPVLIWIAGLDKLCFWFNQVWLDFTGRTIEQEFGNGWTEGLFPEDFDRYINAYINHFDRREEFKMEFRLRRYDGEYRWIQNNGIPRFDMLGEFQGYIGSCLDITDLRQTQAHLQKTINLFSNLSKQIPGVIYQFQMFENGRSCFPYASIGIKDIYDVTPEQVRDDASAVFAVLHPDDYDRIIASIQKSAASMQTWQLEYRVNLVQKGIRWLSGVAHPEKCLDGSIIWHGFISDITERKYIADELYKSESMFRNVIESTSDAIYIKDTAGCYLQVNDATARIVGKSKSEILGKDDTFIFPPDEARTIMETDRMVITNKHLTTCEEVVTTGDGVVRTFLSTKGPVFNKAGNILGIYCIARDITESKKNLEALALSENRLNFALEVSGDGLWDWNMATDEVYFSPRWKEMLGYSDNEISNELEEWASRVHPDDKPQVMIDVQAYLEGKTSTYINEHRVLCKDGSYKWILDRGTVASYAKNGKPMRMIGTHTDMTERRQATEALETAKEKAESLARYKSEFLANMSHEIRTPMNAIIGLSNLALNKEVNDDVRDYLEKISHSSKSLLGILNDILDFSKIEAGKLQIENQRFNLDTVISNLKNLFFYRWNEKHLEFELDIPSDLPVDLIGDALRLQQVLSNLLGNALKFTERGKVILKIKVLEAYKSQIRLQFSVSDTGIGISKEGQNHLFQSFSQVDGSATRRFTGTGLGLVISNNLLKLMGSQITVDSVFGEGSTFSFDLLFTLASHELHHEVNLRQVDHHAGRLTQNLLEHGWKLSGTRILVAEDNIINQQVVKEFLKLSGVQVDIAQTGREALSLLEQNDYDAVLMDVHMPEMNGVEATKSIRKQPRFNKLPIIALTAGVTKEEHDNSLASGMNDFITKPINPEALIDTLVKWIKPLVMPSEKKQAVDEWTVIEESLPGFDLRTLHALINGRSELLLEMLQCFFNDFAGESSIILENLQNHRVDEAEKLLHRLKGVAGSLGAYKLQQSSELLNVELKNGSYNSETLNNWLKEFNNTMVVLENMLVTRT